MELKAIQLTKQYGSKTAVNHLGKLLWMGKTYLYSERSTVIYWDIYRNSLDIIQTLQLGISLCMLRH